jgi:hypothetical protein
MSNTIQRSTYTEGEVLAADDLNVSFDYGRGQIARHERYLHRWGIAEGLVLTAGSSGVTLSAGMAIDATGREIIVGADEQLSTDDFISLNVATAGASKDDWYPVFVRGFDAPVDQPAFSISGCDSSQPTRVEDNYEITFGTPAEATGWDQETVAISSGLGGGSDDTAKHLVLVGFVQWDGTKFTAARDHNANNVRPRYAGVHADSVEARGGTLTLRSGSPDAAGHVAARLDDAGGGKLVFGPQDAKGVITEVFKVDAQGNITAQGNLSAKVAAGTVQVESGIISDGMTLPLPSGITAQDVDAGHAVLHIQVTPRIPGSNTPDGGTHWLGLPCEVSVDDLRRVRCRSTWIDTSSTTALKTKLMGGLCDFIVLAAVKAPGGSNP